MHETLYRTISAYILQDNMELGFVEEVEDPEELTSPYYPSKVGGKPAWLDLFRIPTVEILTCIKCGKTLIHLLQIQSSSLSDEIDYHRTVFLFVCADERCHSPGDSSSFVVLRCELGTNIKSVSNVTSVSNTGSCDKLDCEGPDNQGNKNSSTCTSDTENKTFPVAHGDLPKDEVDPKVPALCIVCGNIGLRHCGNCKQVHYCCREHQVHDWKVGHKQICADLASGKLSPKFIDYNASVGVVFPELDIVTELEPSVCKERKEERSEEERMKDYNKFVKENQRGRVEEIVTAEELEKVASTSTKIDKQFRAFKKRISVEPTQVLRYERNGEPLFVSGEGIPKPSEIPSCKCGAKRTFELQVMPQLLYYLKLDQEDSLSPGAVGGSSVPRAGIDWGTLVIYTCSSACCSLGPGYHQEFLWKQDIL